MHPIGSRRIFYQSLLQCIPLGPIPSPLPSDGEDSTSLSLNDVNSANQALRRILAADYVVVESATPQLVEGLDSQRKQRDAAVLVGWELKFFLRFGSQVRGIGDHRQKLEAAPVLVELAG
eukprot:3082190-Pleurochrysis_carterae.AAC.1